MNIRTLSRLLGVLFLFGLLFSIGATGVAQADWRQFPGLENDHPFPVSNTYGSIVNLRGVPWIVRTVTRIWPDLTIDQAIETLRFDQLRGKWIREKDLRPYRRGSDADHVNAVVINDQIWVDWLDLNSGRVRVSRFDGQDWKGMSDPMPGKWWFPHEPLQLTSVKEGSTSVPYFVFQRGARGAAKDKNLYFVKRYDARTNTWHQVGDPQGQSDNDSNENVAIADVGGTPWIVWQHLTHRTGGYTLYSASFDRASSSWGPPQRVTQSHLIIGLSLVAVSVDGTPTPFVSWSSARNGGNENGKLNVSKFNAGSWQRLGDPVYESSSPGSLPMPTLLDVDGTPWVAADRDGHIDVLRYRSDRDKWEQVGSYLNGPDGSGWIDNATMIGNEPWVVWTEGDSQAARIEPDLLSTGAKARLTDADLIASVNAFGLPFKFRFEYGNNFENSTGWQAASGDDPAKVAATLSDLQPGTTYKYRVVAEVGNDDSNLVVGPEGSFTTDHLPICDPASVTTLRNKPLSVHLHCTDLDPLDKDHLTYSIVKQPDNGPPIDGGSGSPDITYTPKADFSGSDSFAFKATDSEGGESQVATVSVTISSKHAPTCDGNPSSITVAMNRAALITLHCSDLDPDDSLTIGPTAPQPQRGTLQFNYLGGGQAVALYSPDADYVGGDSFAYAATDSDKETSGPVKVSVTVTGSKKPENNDDHTGSGSTPFQGASQSPVRPLPGQFQLISRRLKVRAGSIKLKVKCIGQAACKGKVHLVGSHKKSMTVGRNVGLANGKTKTIKLRLTKNAKRLLKRSGLHAEVVVRRLRLRSG